MRLIDKNINKKLTSFKRRYYLNLLIKGCLLSLSILLSYYLLASLLEYSLWMGRGGRFLILFLFFLIAVYCTVHWLREPLAWWLIKSGLNNEKSAKLIGAFFPSIQDRLLNYLQLSSHSESNSLIEASLEQRANLLMSFNFESVVSLKSNWKYIKYLAIPLFSAIGLAIVNQKIFTQSGHRIIHFNREFLKQPPFAFQIEPDNLFAFANEDYTLNVQLSGDQIPDATYIIVGQHRFKMASSQNGQFSYTFENLNQELNFNVEAAGFFSDSYVVKIIYRPELLNFNVELKYPPYTGIRNEELENIGNLEVPEGTIVKWKLKTNKTNQATILFSLNPTPNTLQLIDNQYFEYSNRFFNSDEYSIALENERSKNKDQIKYKINVTKDLNPTILLEQISDSVLFKSIMLAGGIQDDYGLTKLDLHFSVTPRNGEVQNHTLPIDINPAQTRQSFFFNWVFDSSYFQIGNKIEYYLQVWDNDGINGRKSAKTALYEFTFPTKKEYETSIKNSQTATQKEIEKGVSKAKSLKEAIKQANDRIKGKQNLNWEDKKVLEEIIEKNKLLEQTIDNLQNEFKLLEEKKNSFVDQNKRIREKSEQIQKLMNELLDEETKRLFEELEKLYQENKDQQQIQDVLEKLDGQGMNIEKELERTLALYKQLQYDFKLDQLINDIKSQLKDQNKIIENTEKLLDNSNKNIAKPSEKNNSLEDQNNSPSSEKIAEQQNELIDQAEKFKNDLNELKDLGKPLNNPPVKLENEAIDEMQELEQKSKTNLEQSNPKNASQPQKEAKQKMESIQKELENMQSSMSMEIDQQNLESLKQIVHGLIKLSFDQEDLQTSYKSILSSDPFNNQISQKQLKIKEDFKVLEDSLLAMSKKDPFMQSVVSREVGTLNNRLDQAIKVLKERKEGKASTEMQYSMASINNLALMLSNHLDMLMDMMANAKPSIGKGKKQSLSQMQKMLNNQITEIKNSGKTGRGLSEEMAKLAAEQERIRRAFEEMQNKMLPGPGKSSGNDILEKMEDTELDLVNKTITENTIKRQKEILTRLLESEKADKEKEEDEERKGETAKEIENQIPKAFQDYLRIKEKEVELLNSVSPKLFPYYKKEVYEYFKRIRNAPNK